MPTRVAYIPRLVEYDAMRRRLWIFGQRCHHGAAGVLVAGLACFGLVADPAAPARTTSVVALAAGGLLMIHDRKDLPFWFELGHGSQP